MSDAKRLAHTFAPAPIVSEILKCQISYLQKVGQGLRKQFSHWDHSMSKSTKDSHTFFLPLTVSEILKFYLFSLQKVGQGHVVVFLH